jgi:hypothetical protein
MKPVIEVIPFAVKPIHIETVMLPIVGPELERKFMDKLWPLHWRAKRLHLKKKCL